MTDHDFSLSSDDESAELRRVRNHLEQRRSQPGKDSSDNDASLSDDSSSSSSSTTTSTTTTCSSSGGSEGRGVLEPSALRAPHCSIASTARFTQATAAWEQPSSTSEAKGLQQKHPPTADGTVVVLKDKTTAKSSINDSRIDSASVPPKFVPTSNATTRPGSSHSIDSFSFLDNEDALAELDRQIEQTVALRKMTVSRKASVEESPCSTASPSSHSSGSSSVSPFPVHQSQQTTTNTTVATNKSSKKPPAYSNRQASKSTTQSKGMRKQEPPQATECLTPKRSASNKQANVAAPLASSSSDDDSFAFFSEQELAEIDRRVQLQAEARAATRTAAGGSSGKLMPRSNDPVPPPRHEAATRVPKEDEFQPTNSPAFPTAGRQEASFHEWSTITKQHGTVNESVAASCRPATDIYHSQRKDEAFDRAFGFNDDDVDDFTIDCAAGFSSPNGNAHNFNTAVGSAAHSSNDEIERAFGLQEQTSDRAAVYNKSLGGRAEETIPEESFAPSDNELRQELEESIPGSEGIERDERVPEIHPSCYAPPPHQPKQPPIVHEFSPANRPISARRLIPVSQVFGAPVNSLWKNKFSTFNQVQSEIANMLAYSDDNVVVSAPTGAGKTAVCESEKK
jgi:hypothetical protein